MRRAVHGAVEVGVDLGEQFGPQQRPGLADVAAARHLHLGLEFVHDLAGRGHAHVRGDQRVLDLLPGVLVQGGAGQQVEQDRAQARLGAGQPAAQRGQAAGRRGRALDLPGRGRRLLGGGRRGGAGVGPVGDGSARALARLGLRGRRSGADLAAGADEQQVAAGADGQYGDDDDEDHICHDATQCRRLTRVG
jgi:hypothetical protein